MFPFGVLTVGVTNSNLSRADDAPCGVGGAAHVFRWLPGIDFMIVERRDHGMMAYNGVKIFAPVYGALPWPVRSTVMRAMPGSHRKTWAEPPALQGPAV